MKKWRTTDRFWVLAVIVFVGIAWALFQGADMAEFFTSNYWRR